jgi:hypothetical protein
MHSGSFAQFQFAHYFFKAIEMFWIDIWWQEYQMSLVRDVPEDIFAPHVRDHMIFRNLIPSSPRRIDVLTLDVRGKAFRQKKWPYDDPDEPFPMLGSQQWEDLLQVFTPGAALDHDESDVLIVVSSLPMVWIGTIMVRLMALQVL